MATPQKQKPKNRTARAQIAVYLLRREKAALDAIVAQRDAEEKEKDPRASYTITRWIVDHIKADADARGITLDAADSYPPPAPELPAPSTTTAKPTPRKASAAPSKRTPTADKAKRPVRPSKRKPR